MDETTFTGDIRKCVKELGGGSIKLGASIFLANGTPDTVYYVDIFTFFLESKVHPNRPKKIQWYKIEVINEKGGAAWAITWKDNKIFLEQEKDKTQEFENISKAIDHVIFYLLEKARKRCLVS